MDIGILFAKYCNVKDLQEPHQNALSQDALIKLIAEYESNRHETLVILQKHVVTSEGIDIKNYPIHKPLKFENTMLPLWITILVVSIIFFGISLAMFLSV